MRFTIITIEPSQAVREIHDRMPVILRQEDEKRWLFEPDQSLLRPNPELEAYQVSDSVNSPKNDNLDVINKVRTLIVPIFPNIMIDI